VNIVQSGKLEINISFNRMLLFFFSLPSPDVPDKQESSGSHTPSITAHELFKMLVPHISKSEGNDALREIIITALGHINPCAFRSVFLYFMSLILTFIRCAQCRDLIDELLPLIKEAIDRKQENLRKRKKRDMLRSALVRIFHSMAEAGTFAHRYLFFQYMATVDSLL
jgi:hypothetical protein